MALDRTWGARLWLALLRPASRLYGAAVSVRSVLFQRGILASRRLPVPVISVGNLVVGGTGKTPFVEMLARRLAARGHRVAVILRGYRGRSRRPAIISDGQTLVLEPPHAADEACLLARRLEGVAVLTGVDRYRVGQLAVERCATEVIVLDDGFQHRRLYRDLDIVLLDAGNPFGYDRLIPSGLLREPPAGLGRADMVVLAHAEAPVDLDAVRARVRRYAPKAGVAVAAHRPVELVGLDGDRLAVDRLGGERVLAFCGIANPARFHAMLRRLGGVLVAHRVYPDHHVYSSADLEQVWAAASEAGASMIVTTEKDLVKVLRLPRRRSPAPLYALSIALELIEGAAILDRLVFSLLPSSPAPRRPC
jgi:tetraacyldisaccharide 4'-kinase